MNVFMFFGILRIDVVLGFGILFVDFGLCWF